MGLKYISPLGGLIGNLWYTTVNWCATSSQPIFHQQLTPFKLLSFEWWLVYWLVYWPMFRLTCQLIHWPTYRTSVDQHIYQHVNRQSTDMVITSRPDQYLANTSTNSANHYSAKGCTNYTRFAVSRSIHLLEFYPNKPSVSWRGCKQTNHAKYL